MIIGFMMIGFMTIGSKTMESAKAWEWARKQKRDVELRDMLRILSGAFVATIFQQNWSLKEPRLCGTHGGGTAYMPCQGWC